MSQQLLPLPEGSVDRGGSPQARARWPSSRMKVSGGLLSLEDKLKSAYEKKKSE